MSQDQHTIGCLLGMSVGDALGLPMEGLTPQKIAKWYPNLERYHLVGNKGLCSDDTEHSCMTAQAIAVARQDVQKFQRNLAWRLRWWLLGLPAGIGFATLRSILKLWVGFPPWYSGVFSAGNGPAMRSPILGVVFGHEPQLLADFVWASTCITHRDPKAFWGAFAIAYATYFACCTETITGQSYLQQFRNIQLSHERFQTLPSQTARNELLNLLEKAVISVQQNENTQQFCQTIGLKKGITGYIYHTVPTVIHTWLRNPENYSAGVQTMISCGGDTDTTSAIVGGIIGSRVGKKGIPTNLLNNLIEWPRTPTWLEKLGQILANPIITKELPICPLFLFLRNIVFMWVVLLHGFRRLLP